MRGLRSHLTYANVASTIALVIAVGGGAAYAADTIFSTDIVNGEVKSVDIGNNQVLPVDVRDDDRPGGGLTGADIADQSGVDTCVSTTDPDRPALLQGGELRPQLEPGARILRGSRLAPAVGG